MKHAGAKAAGRSARRRKQLPRALGLDWSGGAAARSKIWAAVIDDQTLVELWRPFTALRPQLSASPIGRRSLAPVPRAIADAFAPWLAEQRFDVAGFDFCFALSAGQAARLRLSGGPSAVGALLAARFGDDAEAFRRAAGPEQRRATDALRSAPFAPTNLRMFRQTFWGLRALAGVRDPIAPFSDGPRRIHEVLPRRRATALCGACRYKDHGLRAERERLLSALRQGGPGSRSLLPGLLISAAQEGALLGDDEGDAIDAVLAALEARDALVSGETAPADAMLSGEGWIYSGSPLCRAAARATPGRAAEC